MADVPIPLARPDTASLGTDATGGSWINDLGAWLDGTVSSVLDTAQGVASNWFDYLTASNQLQATAAQQTQQAQQAALLRSLQTGTGLYPAGTYAVTPTAAGTSGLPAWAVPVGLVVVAGFAALAMLRK